MSRNIEWLHLVVAKKPYAKLKLMLVELPGILEVHSVQ